MKGPGQLYDIGCLFSFSDYHDEKQTYSFCSGFLTKLIQIGSGSFIYEEIRHKLILTLWNLVTSIPLTTIY